MKKVTKIISVLALLFSLFVALGSGMIEMVQAVDDEVTVTLHKKKMTALPEFQQNTGKEMDFFSSYDDMPNVYFTAYDVSDQFYGLRAGGSTFEAALTAVATSPDTTEPRGTATTGTNGQVSFNLAAKSDGKDAIYVFVETAAPAGTTPADNLVLALPMYDANDELMTDILLYPKNLVKADGRVTVTKKGTAEGNDLLEGAQFIVSRELTKDNIEYIASFNMEKGLYNWVADRDDALPFTTNSAGTFSILGLEHGDYNLIEIAAPGNASIIDDGITPFTISDNATILAFDVFNDTILVDKDRDDKDDYNVGDLIPYSITVNIPEGMGYQFPDDTYRHPTMTITDAPDLGLQFNNDLVLTAGTTTIPVDPSWLDTTGNGFELTLPASALAAYKGQNLTLTYNMYLDGNAEPDIGYDNLATVTTDELSDNDYTPDVYTGGFRFLKIDANSPTTVLNEAVFVVGRGEGTGIEYLVMANNTVSWTTDINTATEFESGIDGIVEVAGLEYGNYWLRETAAPEGYVLPDGFVDFEITEGTFTQIDLMEITNVHRGRLPSTGGSGILGIVGIGAALVATTGGYYIKRKRDE